MLALNSSLVTGLIGGVLCLFGFVLYWGGLKVLALFLGGSVGALLATAIAYIAELDSTVTLAVMGLGALLGAVLGWRFIKAMHRVIVFLIGAGLGFLAGKYILPGFGEAWTASWIPLASPLIGGVLAVLLFRYIIILVTAAVGSFMLYQATNLGWVMGLAFAIGLLVQIGAFHGLGLNKRAEKEQR